MKKIFVLVSALVALVTSFSANALADMSNPYTLANEVATTTVNKIKLKKNKLSDPDVGLEIIEKNLMPYIDIKYASYKVMGPSLKSTTPDERERFTTAFANYMKKNFSSVLSKYTSQEIVPADVKPVKDDENLVSVKLIIREDGKKDLELILKLRKNNKTGEWKAFDMIGENISMLDAKISEISPIIKSSGVDAAIAKLNSSETK